MASKAMEAIIEATKQAPKLSVSPNTDFAALRKLNDDTNRMMPTEKGVTYTEEKVGGVSTEHFVPENNGGDTVVILLHGGAFVFGSLITSRAYASTVCGESGLDVYTVDYRLAPEHKFPCGAEDCFSVYKALTEKYPDKKIALVGESAGATFALVTAHMAKDRGLTPPCCVCAFSPCVDFGAELESRTKNAESDVLIRANIMPDMKRLYLSDTDDTFNPYISPYYGDYNGFPPLMLVADNGEIFADDTRLLCKKASDSGVDVKCTMYDGTFHSFPALGRMTEESNAVLKETVGFIKNH